METEPHARADPGGGSKSSNTRTTTAARVRDKHSGLRPKDRPTMHSVSQNEPASLNPRGSRN
jgi:hypothetical protein